MSDPAAALASRLAELWRSSLPVIEERVTVLRATCATLSRQPGDIRAQRAGREAAHKLSGVLGVFGLPQGSELAAMIEEILKGGNPLPAESMTTLAELIEQLDAAIASKKTPPQPTA